MTYITQSGDTLMSIAARWTISPEYGSAIARQNGLTTDIYNTPVDIALEPGLALEIPDHWLQGGGRNIIDITATGPKIPEWTIWAIGAVILLISIS